MYEGEPEAVRAELRRYTRRSVLWAAAAVAGSFVGLKLLNGATRADGLPWPLRRALETNEALFGAVSSHARRTREYPPGTAVVDRLNGDIALGPEFDPTNWRLELQHGGGQRLLTLDEVKSLPSREMTAEFRCIEGWSAVMRWRGVPFAEFLRALAPGQESRAYVAAETPDGGYYVGLDMENALHPQTMLAYELNGKPLTPQHGAPLRLVVPVKYGVKSLKRVGRIVLTDDRPRDFWAERGYDWYCGI